MPFVTCLCTSKRGYRINIICIIIIQSPQWHHSEWLVLWKSDDIQRVVFFHRRGYFKSNLICKWSRFQCKAESDEDVLSGSQVTMLCAKCISTDHFNRAYGKHTSKSNADCNWCFRICTPNAHNPQGSVLLCPSKRFVAWGSVFCPLMENSSLLQLHQLLLERRTWWIIWSHVSRLIRHVP